VKWERAEVGEESGERTGRVWRAGNGNPRKKPKKTQQIKHLGKPFGGYRPMLYTALLLFRSKLKHFTFRKFD